MNDNDERSTHVAPQAPWRWTPAKIEEMAASLLEFMQDPQHLFYKQWCVQEGIPASHVSRFAEMSETFASALEKANDIQEVRLIERGLSGKYHHAIVKLILGSKFNYLENTALTVTTPNSKPILGSIEDCDKAIAEAQAQKNAFENMLAEARQLRSAVVEG
jgi:hypothetical protein